MSSFTLWLPYHYSHYSTLWYDFKFSISTKLSTVSQGYQRKPEKCIFVEENPNLMTLPTLFYWNINLLPSITMSLYQYFYLHQCANFHGLRLTLWILCIAVLQSCDDSRQEDIYGVPCQRWGSTLAFEYNNSNIICINSDVSTAGALVIITV